MNKSSTLGNCNAIVLIPAPKTLQGTDQLHSVLVPVFLKTKLVFIYILRTPRNYILCLRILELKCWRGGQIGLNWKKSRGYGQNGGYEAQILRKRLAEEKDCGAYIVNTLQYLLVRVEHLHPQKVFWASSRVGRVGSS